MGESIDLSGDGGVLKKILKEGSGEEFPPKYGRVRVNYTGKFENGQVFDASKGDPFNFKLGKGEVIKAWDIGIASMKKGEQAQLTCRSDYAYGKDGSPPTIPADSTLIFDVELVSWSDPDPETTPERLKAAEKAKAEGNDLFKAKDYKEALEKYNNGLEFFSNLWGLEEEEKKQVDAIKLSLLLNASACQLELKDYGETILSCCKALDIDTNNVKALFRRGKAYLAGNEFEKAKSDLMEAAKLQPNNKDIRQELTILKTKVEEFKKKEKEIFGGMFK